MIGRQQLGRIATDLIQVKAICPELIKLSPTMNFLGRSRFRLLGLGSLLTLLSRLALHAEDAYEKPPINYSTTAPQDVVTRLQSRVASGTVTWTGGGKAVLRQLLQELNIPVESQLLVFSKTSFQRTSISPKHPRAVYFADTAYVGWVPGGLIEVAVIDPQLGPVFYSFNPTHATPKFERDQNCLACHGGVFIRDIPSVFVRSVFPDDKGEPQLRLGSELVDFRTPFTNRWGGWYVTGQHGNALHRGNLQFEDDNGKLPTDFTRGANVTDLSSHFATRMHLTNSSDIVAFLVLEHQTAMQNTLTRAAFDCRRMLAYQKNLQTELKEPVTTELTYDSVKSVFASAAQDIVADLLFKDEASLPAGLRGAGAFEAAFGQNARHASNNTSLRDFHLNGHLFKNRCSYLIYSDFFLNLPAELKRQVYARLHHVLRSTKADPQYDYLPAAERTRILQILTETHPEFRHAVSLL